MLIWLSISLGYGFAVVIGHFPISWIVDKLWDEAEWRQRSEVRPAAYAPRIVGFVERTLYVASFQFDLPEFIAVWLALKAAGQWNRWEEDVAVGERKISGRFFYSIFLIGSGLSVIYAAIGAQIIKHLARRTGALRWLYPWYYSSPPVH